MKICKARPTSRREGLPIPTSPDIAENARNRTINEPDAVRSLGCRVTALSQLFVTTNGRLAIESSKLSDFAVETQAPGPFDRRTGIVDAAIVGIGDMSRSPPGNCRKETPF